LISKEFFWVLAFAQAQKQQQPFFLKTEKQC